jgi:hypothetical protein
MSTVLSLGCRPCSQAGLPSMAMHTAHKATLPPAPQNRVQYRVTSSKVPGGQSGTVAVLPFLPADHSTIAPHSSATILWECSIAPTKQHAVILSVLVQEHRFRHGTWLVSDRSFYTACNRLLLGTVDTIFRKSILPDRGLLLVDYYHSYTSEENCTFI